jgi:hypothetical protein
MRRRGLARIAVLAVTIGWTAVHAGPVDLYLKGAEFCPRDRRADAPRMPAADVPARARTMLPKDYCGPTLFVSGCTFDVENEYDSWRVYVHQYKDRGGRQDKGGLLHTYIILDAVGNCLAHMPGTEFGANS